MKILQTEKLKSYYFLLLLNQASAGDSLESDYQLCTYTYIIHNAIIHLENNGIVFQAT